MIHLELLHYEKYSKQSDYLSIHSTDNTNN